MPARFLTLLGLIAFAAVVRGAETTPAPRLVVVISVDQLRGDYLGRFAPYFGEGGFKRLLQGGTHFTRAYHRHAITHTGPGHATILTGVFADVHGIVSNDWIDPVERRSVNCVEDAASPLVGISPAELGPTALANPSSTGRSPRNMLADTIGDVLKRRHGDKARVFAAANKDRSAILLGGRLADAAYWDENGRMVTARHYRSALPAWVEAFNAEGRAQAAFGRTWERLLEAEPYERVQGPDDADGEASPAGFTRTFPKQITGGKPTLTPAFYGAFDLSPFATELLGAFAQRAVVEEKLGRYDATDLLCLGFAQIDAIGHSYGPHSHEVMDSILRLDRVLAALFDLIDREVGLTHCLIVLTSDHGVAPLPERQRVLHPEQPSGRLKSADLSAALTKALDAEFGPLPAGETWLQSDAMSFHVRPSALAAKGVEASLVARVLKRALSAAPGIQHAFTREELLAASPAWDDDTMLALNRRSYHASRGRDVQYVTQPYFLFSRSTTGTSHGTAHDYDRRVPLLWFGRGIPAATRGERVGVDDIAPTLAALLNVPAPPEAKGRRLFPDRVAGP